MTVASLASALASTTTRFARGADPVSPPPSIFLTSVWSRGLSAAALVMCTIGAAQAADPPARVPSDTVVLLTRIQQAAEHQNYSGTYVHQQGNQVQSSRVVHLIDRNGEHEKLELLDGQEREFIRNNDDVRCYVPDNKLVLVEKRARYDTFPALLTTEPGEIDRYYQLSMAGTDRVAGRIAQVIVLDARDRQRYGYRLWFDRDTSLLLKAQTIGDKGTPIEQVAFNEITIGGSIDPSRVKPTATNTDGWRIETNRMIPVDLAKAGWSVAQPVAGFHQVMVVRRAFGGREDIGQMVYSDGLAAISIFIEPVAPQGAVEGDATKGPVNIVMKRHGDFWLTIVGDAPAAAIREMGNAIEYRPPAK